MGRKCKFLTNKMSGSESFANSTIPFDSQAGIVAGGFVFCLLLLLLLGLIIFGIIKCSCGGGSSFDDCCFALFLRWMCYKCMCFTCCSSMKRRMQEDVELLERQDREMVRNKLGYTASGKPALFTVPAAAATQPQQQPPKTD